MTGKIFKNSFILGAAVLILCAVLFFGVQYAQTKEETYSALRQEAAYAASGLMMNGEDYLSSVRDQNRITWIAEDGSVIYDSESGTDLSNQKDQEEVASALSEGEGHSIRSSSRGGVQTMYYAVRCEDGTVLRLSRPIAAVRAALSAVSPVLWIFVLVLLISGVLAFRAAKQLIEPINEISLDDPDSSKTYPELSPLIDRIREQKLTISEQMDELARRQREFTALTENMSEGFVITDRNGIVLSANNAACRSMGCEEGDDLKNEEHGELAKDVAAALSGKRTERVKTDGDISRRIVVDPVTSREKVTGAVIFISDVTEREQRERLRREFSANVSHELKTPLTSISGFAELMMQDMVPPEKIKEFSSDIYRESHRLIILVEDIIKLSKLDEQDNLPALETVELYSAALGTADSLKPAADKAGVTIRVTGGPAGILGIERYVDEIIYNLCDNAVKYNKEGGSVDIGISEKPDGVYLTVKDTGIGIPYEHQERIFERFYRVNKSHSKAVAGTGLGLSIVKHAAQACGAKTFLESEPGEGTEITVVFQKAV